MDLTCQNLKPTVLLNLFKVNILQSKAFQHNMALNEKKQGQIKNPAFLKRLPLMQIFALVQTFLLKP
jgi:hypothetical protein